MKLNTRTSDQNEAEKIKMTGLGPHLEWNKEETKRKKVWNNLGVQRQTK